MTPPPIQVKMRFPLNNGQANTVKTRPGLGGDAAKLPKAPEMYKGYIRDVQGMYKGCTRDNQGNNTGATPEQHRSNTGAIPEQYRSSSQGPRHST
jgi:hypothetical protein